MATTQLTASSISARNVASFEGLRPSAVQFPFVGHVRIANLTQRSFKGLVVKAATVVAPKVIFFFFFGPLYGFSNLIYDNAKVLSYNLIFLFKGEHVILAFNISV